MAKQRTPTLQVRVIKGTCDICKAADKLIPGSKELDTLYELFLRAANRHDSNSVVYVHYTCIRLAIQKADKASRASTTTLPAPLQSGAPVIDAAIAAFEHGGDSEDR